ncbi:hypothetical protein DERP_009688 [Dermatophagoides pteronyssinus]|uniref:Uncharacterized protein n=1 Tax=Dermatophagoides pteronyssinus TaxID=6956 RepID=A0ABQ8JAK7_DERPT|nr:hypothetical protein DERP_009688 [Dermatophagoides pteronyssinus]
MNTTFFWQFTYFFLINETKTDINDILANNKKNNKNYNDKFFISIQISIYQITHPIFMIYDSEAYITGTLMITINY